MSGNRHVYRHINSELRQLYPDQMNGNQVRHLNTLAAMIAGIVLSQQSHLEKIARKMPSKTQVESRIKRFTRFNQHEEIDAEHYFLPFVMPLITTLATTGVLTLAIDGSVTGRGCITLMVSIIYQKRAIPIAWVTVKGKKGHLPEETHVALMQRVQPLIPPECTVIFLGDGEFDGLDLLRAIEDAGWKYVCRTGCNRVITDDGDTFSLSELCLKPGDMVEMAQVEFGIDCASIELVIAWWHKDYDKPIFLVSNMLCAEEACYFYRRRFRIETFFSDQKSRGFNLQRSHIADNERIERFLIATCLAYIWMIYLGVQVRGRPDVMKIIHRTDRCDLSLFQLGLRYFEHLINHEILITFSLEIPA